MLFALITISILSGVLLYVLEPYFTGNKLPAKFITSKQRKQAALSIKRDEITGSVMELEQDYNTGKVALVDYKKLIIEYRADLSTVVNQLEQFAVPGKKEDVRNQIEAEVQLLRKTANAVSFPDEESGVLVCPECNIENVQNSNFCPNCGMKLK
ncbi:MAG: zinc ribbon domain-containing protein [bacterium]|nr:zinc ribbon domain-containing protein [bacterium]